MSETFVLHQITALLELGHDVRVFALQETQETQRHEGFERYRLADRTRFGVKIPRGFVRKWLTAKLIAAKLLFTRPRELFYVLNPWRFGREVLSLKLLFATTIAAEDEPFDAIHCHFGPSGIVGCALVALGRLRGPVVTTFHGYDASKYLRYYGARPYRTLFGSGAAFVTISDYLKRKVAALGCPPDLIQTIYLGVDLSRYQFRERPAKSGSLDLLSVCSLLEKKGLTHALDAVARFKAAGGSFRYRVVGDGPLRRELEAKARRLGLQGEVEFLGSRKNEDVAELLQTADALLAPSVTARNLDIEGIPVVLMEAMATGTLVITTRYSGIPELVEHQRSGYLTNEADVPALVECLTRIAHRTDDLDAMRRRARTRTEEVFNLDASVRAVEALLARVSRTKV